MLLDITLGELSELSETLTFHFWKRGITTKLTVKIREKIYNI